MRMSRVRQEYLFFPRFGEGTVRVQHISTIVYPKNIGGGKTALKFVLPIARMFLVKNGSSRGGEKHGGAPSLDESPLFFLDTGTRSGFDSFIALSLFFRFLVSRQVLSLLLASVLRTVRPPKSSPRDGKKSVPYVFQGYGAVEIFFHLAALYGA